MQRREFEKAIAPYAVTIREPKNIAGVEGEAYVRNHLVVVRKDTGGIVATIRRDDIFDVEGNRFYFSGE